MHTMRIITLTKYSLHISVQVMCDRVSSIEVKDLGKFKLFSKLFKLCNLYETWNEHRKFRIKDLGITTQI